MEQRKGKKNGLMRKLNVMPFIQFKLNDVAACYVRYVRILDQQMNEMKIAGRQKGNQMCYCFGYLLTTEWIELLIELSMWGIVFQDTIFQSNHKP